MAQLKDNKYVLEIERGSTKDFSFRIGQYVTEEGVKVFDPYDITGWTVRMKIRKDTPQAEEIASYSTTASTITLVPLEGRASLTISAADTAAMPLGRHNFDVETVDTGGKVKKPIKGVVLVSKETTR